MSSVSEIAPIHYNEDLRNLDNIEAAAGGEDKGGRRLEAIRHFSREGWVAVSILTVLGRLGLKYRESLAPGTACGGCGRR